MVSKHGPPYIFGLPLELPYSSDVLEERLRIQGLRPISYLTPAEV